MSRNSPHDRHRRLAARSSRRRLAFEHMNDGGRLVGGCCVGKRAMARSSNLMFTKGAINMFGRGLPTEVERRRTRVKNFQPRPIGMDLDPALAMGVR